MRRRVWGVHALSSGATLFPMLKLGLPTLKDGPGGFHVLDLSHDSGPQKGKQGPGLKLRHHFSEVCHHDMPLYAILETCITAF